MVLFLFFLMCMVPDSQAHNSAMQKKKCRTLVMSVSVATSCTYAMCDPMVTVGAKGAPLPYRSGVCWCQPSTPVCPTRQGRACID